MQKIQKIKTGDEVTVAIGGDIVLKDAVVIAKGKKRKILFEKDPKDSRYMIVNLNSEPILHVIKAHPASLLVLHGVCAYMTFKTGLASCSQAEVAKSLNMRPALVCKSFAHLCSNDIMRYYDTKCLKGWIVDPMFTFAGDHKRSITLWQDAGIQAEQKARDNKAMAIALRAVQLMNAGTTLDDAVYTARQETRVLSIDIDFAWIETLAIELYNKQVENLLSVIRL